MRSSPICTGSRRPAAAARRGASLCPHRTARLARASPSPHIAPEDPRCGRLAAVLGATTTFRLQVARCEPRTANRERQTAMRFSAALVVASAGAVAVAASASAGASADGVYLYLHPSTAGAPPAVAVRAGDANRVLAHHLGVPGEVLGPVASKDAWAFAAPSQGARGAKALFEDTRHRLALYIDGVDDPAGALLSAHPPTLSGAQPPVPPACYLLRS